MAFLQDYALSITPLSPLHIGCNETYEPTNYVIENNTLYEFSPFDALQALDEDERKKLQAIVERKPNEEMLKRVQQYFYDRRHALLAFSSHYLPVAEGVADLYNNRVGKTAQQESHHKGVINKLEIERTAYNSLNRKAFLPGSSFKGALRTALLNYVNQGRKLTHPAEKNNALQQRLFGYTFRDMSKDPLRLIHIADAHWQAKDLADSQIYFAVNRHKKQRQVEGRLLASKAEQQGMYQLVECIPAFCYRSLSGSLTLHNVDSVKQHARHLPAEKFRWSIQTIAEACNAFYLPLLEKELHLLDTLRYADPEWMAQLQTIQQSIRNNPHNRFLLRVGQHSGAEATTLNGIRSIGIMKGKGNKKEWRDEASTLWLASNHQKQQQGMQSFGWLLVEIDAPANDTQNSMAEQQHQAMQQWQQQNQALQQQALADVKRQQAVKQQQREREKEQAEQQRAQQQKQAQALAAKKSAMSALAGKFFMHVENNNWRNDKNAFWQQGKEDSIEDWLDRLEADNDAELWQQISELMTIHFRGVMENPDKTKGKKNKPVYKPRVKNIAKRLLALKQGK